MSKTTITYAIVYVRVSEDRSGELMSPEDQLAVLRSRAESRGWIVLHVVAEDKAISASRYARKQRPGFTRLLALVRTEPARIRARNPEAEIVVMAWEGSRVTRRGAEREQWLELCDEQRVTLNYLGCDYDPRNPDQRQMLSIMGSSDQRASAITSMQVTRRVNARIEEGTNHGRMPRGYVPIGIDPRTRKSLGWKLDFHVEKNGRIVDNPQSKAAAIKLCIENIIAGESGATGDSIRAAHSLYEKMTGERVELTGFARMLRRPTYAGIRTHNGVETGEGNWPALITREQHRDLVEILSNINRISNAGGVAPKWLGSGVITCGACGRESALVSKMLRDNRSGELIETRVYSCRFCHGVSIPADPVDKLIEAAMIRYLTDPAVIRGCNSGPDSYEHSEELEELKQLERELNEWQDASTLPVGNPDRVSRQSLAKWEAKNIPRIEDLRAITRTTEYDPHLARYTSSRAGKLWGTWSIEEQRSLIRTALDMTVLPCGKGHRRMRGEEPTGFVIAWRRYPWLVQS